MTPRVDRDAVSFPAWVLTVTTVAGKTFRRVYLRPGNAIRYARGAHARDFVADIERVTVVRSRNGGSP